ncbi:uncharacterized protein N7511_010297 [Penicillium nucicola]|uniref:uncharacterized protein n=1 Tax=Penicillium nucicola TaxID=1850975 RepID=UPI00254521F7|nr:uncharacterized protein N7511_010297 [Penicillium nucicola]KAJ5748601.1 hypothetical protein N7511_010297 [Penicillium nucicola]
MEEKFHNLPVLSRPWPSEAPDASVDHVNPQPYPSQLPLVPGPAPVPPQPQPPTQPKARNAPAKVRKPRKANANASGKSTLFWVNSDPQTAAEGTTEETLKRIRSHVMSEHNRKKRMESTKQYNKDKWKQTPYQTPAGALGSATSGRGLGPARASISSAASLAGSGRRISEESEVEEVGMSNALVTSSSSSSAGYPVGSGASIWEQGDHGYGEAAAYPSIWSCVGQGANDPFHTGHTQLTDRMMSHLRVFLWDLTQEAHPLQTRYKPKLQAHWASLIQRDPAILHATICMATSNTAMQAGELPIRDPNQKRSQLVIDTFHHRGETIRLVNEGLSDPVKASSDVLIAAVSTLLTIEIASGNPDYLKIHLAGLRQMIALRKNFDEVPSDVRFQISWTDIRVACMAHAKPIFPFQRASSPLLKIPGIFGEAMPQIIYDLLELSWYAEWIKGKTGYREFNEETEDYFNTEVLYVEYMLHTDRYTPTGQVKGDNSIEGCTRLACLLFHNSAIWSFYPMVAQLLPKPILALRAALAATIPMGLFALCRDLLIWQLVMGAVCSATLPAERAFFVSELAAAARLQGISTWQEARALLLGFFYVDRVHLPMLRQVWDEVLMQCQVEPA